MERPRHGAGSAWWARWCFVKVCLKHFWKRLVLIAIILFGGAILFHRLEPEKNASFAKAAYNTFALVFGEQPEEFPQNWALQVLFFIVPILGLTVIIEAIIDFALMLRDRRRYERSWCIMLAASFKDHIVLVGLGRLGYRTFLTLRRLGQPIVVIERNPESQFLEEVRRDGSPLLIGDGRHEAFLEDANISRARSIILATDDDMANLEVALDARKINPDVRVVIRMFDQNVADKVRDGFNIHLAMSESSISAPTFATCALAPATINSMVIGDQVVAMQRWLVRAGDPLDGKTVGEIMRGFKVGIVQHERPDAFTTICPDPDATLQPGDGLILQGPIATLESLRARGQAVPAA